MKQRISSQTDARNAFNGIPLQRLCSVYIQRRYMPSALYAAAVYTQSAVWDLPLLCMLPSGISTTNSHSRCYLKNAATHTRPSVCALCSVYSPCYMAPALCICMCIHPNVACMLYICVRAYCDRHMSQYVACVRVFVIHTTTRKTASRLLSAICYIPPKLTLILTKPTLILTKLTLILTKLLAYCLGTRDANGSFVFHQD